MLKTKNMIEKNFNTYDIDEVVDQGQYYIECINFTSENLLPDRVIQRNKELIESIIYDLRLLDYSPKSVAKALESVFSNISKIGYR